MPLGAGNFTYAPAANFHGTDMFTYTVRDSSGATATATVTLTVTPVDDSPVAANDSYTVVTGNTLAVPAATGVLANDFDGDGDVPTAVLASGPVKGTLALQPSGAFTYTPNAGVTGTDSFTYRAFDGVHSSPTATVIIAINPAGVLPSLSINNVEVTEGNS